MCVLFLPFLHWTISYLILSPADTGEGFMQANIIQGMAAKNWLSVRNAVWYNDMFYIRHLNKLCFT